MIKPPLRLPGETETQYQAFTRYIFLGKERTIQKAYEWYLRDAGKLGNGKGRSNHYPRWAAQFDWVSRAAEYDNAVNDFIAQSLAEKVGEKLLTQHYEFEKAFQLQSVIGRKLLSSIGKLSTLEPAKIREARAELDHIQKLCNSFSSVVASIDRTQSAWSTLNGLEEINEKLELYNAEKTAKNVIPIDSRPEPRSLSLYRKMEVDKAQIDRLK
jgi:hypothetical protein